MNAVTAMYHYLWYVLAMATATSTFIQSTKGTVLYRRPVNKESWAHVGRVIGGTDASQGVYPFMAFLMVDDGDLTAFCGGTIIARQWILTAAHCVVDTSSGGDSLTNKTQHHPKGTHIKARKFKSVKASKVKVGVGSIYNARTHTYSVSKVHVHPDLNLDYFDNDIALLKLKKKLRFDDNVQPIHIDTDTVTDGLVVTGIGWGKTTLESQTTANTLQQVDLRIGNEALCKRIRPQFTGNNGDYICVTTPDGRDTCSGDSGGPLLRRCTSNPNLSGSAGSGPWVQLGITSYGDNAERDANAVCASSNGAGFYTHIAPYLGFISKTTGIKQKDLAARCNGPKVEFVGTSDATGVSPSVAFSALVIAIVVEVLFSL
ncbi:hypothetical protein IW140_005475 [Coemansia sp. RSA 1813]|nr:hypothetical protein EV178_005819 [Coemansia sp. RSA 1646]KAJ1768652.1 hypothetical protein LPJ74_004714 [Coemansia sp. RSA 1843]KAJ2086555.1 hypothetical protein IW138_005595 [Coemansia sp. RSA 986]KAJ2211222.1 hypothetical protein EV179_005680 [Coemansia sp. RSA 487]KAJ2565045.1 hypothetical protein IW140_005475 [Coemansia sp. RSA 1813]